MGQFRREDASRGVGRRFKKNNRNHHQKELRGAAQQTHSLKSMFQHHIDNGVPVLKSENTEDKEKRKETHHVVGHEEMLRLARQKAGTDLDRLLRLKTEQKKKYGYVLSSKTNLLRRHLLLQAFFNLQPHKFG